MKFPLNVKAGFPVHFLQGFTSWNAKIEEAIYKIFIVSKEVILFTILELQAYIIPHGIISSIHLTFHNL
jgi:hypothetical protein